jgi:hypothetical protein
MGHSLARVSQLVRPEGRAANTGRISCTRTQCSILRAIREGVLADACLVTVSFQSQRHVSWIANVTGSSCRYRGGDVSTVVGSHSTLKRKGSIVPETLPSSFAQASYLGGYLDTWQSNRPSAGSSSDNPRPTRFPHLPRTSTMASISQRPRERVLPTLDVFIQALNIAKDTCGVPAAEVAFGSASVLLTMIRVRPPYHATKVDFWLTSP